MNRRARAAIFSVALHVTLIAAALLSVIPLLYVLFAAFKSPQDLLNHPLSPIGPDDGFTLDNFRLLMAAVPLARWMLNSLVLASMYTVIVVVLCSMSGFALAKYDFRGRGALIGLMIVALLVPPQAMLPATYRLICTLHWTDSYLAILGPGAVNLVGVLLYRQAMRQAPADLLHAARLDGASEWRLWWEICLPIVRPMTGAFALLSFCASWNGFLWPQVVLEDPHKFTLPIGLANMTALAEYQTQPGLLMAATLLGVAPVAALFLWLQKDLISGLASGAVH
jgi:ABC-type glycerol-3-phosphate transport system permease component